jgi:hypothetical protein
MAVTGCDEHCTAVAESSKGDCTSAPFPGLLTVTPAIAGNAEVRTTAARNTALRGRFMDTFRLGFGDLLTAAWKA